MKMSKPFLAALLLVGSLGSNAIGANDGVLLKEPLTPGGSYCHMKFPAIQPSTVYGNNPQLRSSDSADIIDYYGPCNETPLSKDQVESQRIDDMGRQHNTNDQ